MDAIHISNKGRMLDILEKFYIYREMQLGTQLILTECKNITRNQDERDREDTPSDKQYIEGAVPLRTYRGNRHNNIQQNFHIQASGSDSTNKTFTDTKINKQQ
jgi:hypothetical protein